MKQTNNLTQLLKLVRDSIKYGYLQENWHNKKMEGETLVKIESGYIALQDDTIETEEGSIFHTDNESDEYGFDEIDDCYRNSDCIVFAYGKRGGETYTSPDNCEEYRGQYFSPSLALVGFSIF